MCQNIQEIVLSLTLGSVTLAFAQVDYTLPHEMLLASVDYVLQGDSPSQGHRLGYMSQLRALGWRPRPLCARDSKLSYSMTDPGPGGEEEPDQPTDPGDFRLADAEPDGSPTGWHIGSDGLLSYTTRNERWHLAFRYEPNLGALLGDFDHLYSFSLIWQFSLGKRRPAKWADVPFPNMRPLQLPPEPPAGARPF